MAESSSFHSEVFDNIGPDHLISDYGWYANPLGRVMGKETPVYHLDIDFDMGKTPLYYNTIN